MDAATLQYAEVIFDGVPLRVPIINGKTWDDWAAETVDTYPRFCGAGEGIGEKAVPDTNYRLRISVVCHIHDVCWQLAPPTEQARQDADEVFLINHLELIRARSQWWLRMARNYRALTYYNMVDCEKNWVFWKIKAEDMALTSRQ